MQFVCVNNINEYLEDFLFAKVDVEKKLLEDNIIEKRMKLEDFILYLDLQNKIYMKGQKSIAFNILEGLNNTYIFYSFLDLPDDELFKAFSAKLEKIKYNFSKLTKLSNMDLLEVGALDNDMFILNFEFFK
jgi:hypothetical protein